MTTSDSLTVMVNKPGERELVQMAFTLDTVTNVWGWGLLPSRPNARYVHLGCRIGDVHYPMRVAVGAFDTPRDRVALEGLALHCTARWLREGDYASLPEWAVDHALKFLERPENAYRVYTAGGAQ